MQAPALVLDGLTKDLGGNLPLTLDLLENFEGVLFNVLSCACFHGASRGLP